MASTTPALTEKEKAKMEVVEEKAKVRSEIYEIYKALRELREHTAFLNFVEVKFREIYLEAVSEKLKLENEIKFLKDLKEKLEFDEADEKVEKKLKEFGIIDEKETIKINGIKELAKRKLEYKISSLHSKASYITYVYLQHIEQAIKRIVLQKEELEKIIDELYRLLDEKLKQLHMHII
jgi:hypothetical protein